MDRHYLDILEKLVKDNKTSEIDHKLGITIPKSEILMVSKFDMGVFNNFNDDDSEDNIDEEIPLST